MRVKGKIARQWIVILIYSGITNNFVDTAVSSRIKFSICAQERVRVQLANCDQLVSEGNEQKVKMNIQDFSYSLDLLMLDLARCDAILGVQWLKTLGTIAWNFEQLTMQFQFNGKKIRLLGLGSTKWLEESYYHKRKKLETKGVLL